jgi:hypothetical protein
MLCVPGELEIFSTLKKDKDKEGKNEGGTTISQQLR